MSATAETSAAPTAQRLSVYLNAHLADETRGLEFVKRAMAAHAGTPLGTFMELLSWELEEDRDILMRVMGRLGVRRRRARLVLARLAGKAGGRLTGHSPLVELESLHRGVEGKLDMWKALRYSVEGIDFDQLIRRAERQAEEIERRRLAVAATALAFRNRPVRSARAPRGLPAAPSGAPAGS